MREHARKRVRAAGPARALPSVPAGGRLAASIPSDPRAPAMQSPDRNADLGLAQHMGYSLLTNFSSNSLIRPIE